jgi:hypothetical protein
MMMMMMMIVVMMMMMMVEVMMMIMMITTNTTKLQILFHDIYQNYLYYIKIEQYHYTITTDTTTTTTTSTIPDNVDARACLFSVNPISDSILSHASLNRIPYIPLIFPKNWRCSRTVSIG